MNDALKPKDPKRVGELLAMINNHPIHSSEYFEEMERVNNALIHALRELCHPDADMHTIERHSNFLRDIGWAA